MRAISIRGASVLDGRWCNEAEHGRYDGVRTQAEVEMSLDARSRHHRSAMRTAVLDVGSNWLGIGHERKFRSDRYRARLLDRAGLAALTTGRSNDQRFRHRRDL